MKYYDLDSNPDSNYLAWDHWTKSLHVLELQNLEGREVLSSLTTS